MREIALTPLHEDAYRRLARFLESYRFKVYLPLLRSLCIEATRPSRAPWVPESLLRVWEPLLGLVHSGRFPCECYLEEVDVKNTVETGLKIALLVLKARVFGKIDLNEWLLLVPQEPLKPRFTYWSGLLVVDRYIDYYVMVKNGVYADRVVQVDVFAPTPLDLLVLVAKNAVEWMCGIEDVIWWVVKYIAEYVIPSSNLTEAYRRLTGSAEYVEFIEMCAPSEEVLHYWSWTPRL